MPAAPFDLGLVSRGLPAARLVGSLDALLAADDARAVVVAPPGSGKTTVVPPLVANLVARAIAGDRPASVGRVVVTQPRRVAARAAARRLAQLTGTRVGDLVGYAVRDERRSSAATRVEFVTEGLLVRRLLADPELAGVGAVVFDEIHERNLDGDLAFAMAGEVAELRGDLRLVAMSATLDGEAWARRLGDGAGGPAALVEVAATPHPLAVEWAPAPSGAQRLDARGVTRDYLDHVARTAAAVARRSSTTGTLVFVPGTREIARVVDGIRGILEQGGTGVEVAAGGDADGIDVLALHGGMPAAAQDSVLAPSPRRRVIVSTALAESSLTVPGVDAVVDAGLSREPRIDLARGASTLVTVRASRAAAEQRAGRAARTGPGVVVRAYPESEWAAMRPDRTPEIAVADLASAALDLACWGAPLGVGLDLPDAVPEAAGRAAESTLRAIGAVDEHGRATDLGRALARIPADPRIARALLEASGELGARRAAEAAAVLVSDERAPGGDLAALWRRLRDDRGGAGARWRADADRFERIAGAGTGAAGPAAAGVAADAADDSPRPRRADAASAFPKQRRATDDEALALVVALAHPDRIARARTAIARSGGGQGGAASASGGGSPSGPGTGGGRGSAPSRPGARPPVEFLLAGGTGASVDAASPLAGAEWLAIAELGGASGSGAGASAVVRAAVPLSAEAALRAGAALLTASTETAWADGRVRARRVRGLGAIDLSSTPVEPDVGAARDAVARALARDGLGVFDWSEAATALRRRLALLHRVLGGPWPDVSDAALAASAADWLAPEIDALARGRAASRVDLVDAVRRLLPWPEASRLDELAPERLEVPSGSRHALDYPAADDPDGRVVLAVKLQECFGWTRTPRIADGRVPVQLHLLSPARRPLAVTDDLEFFWREVYASVRAENRGRYAKHPWPEDPLTAEAKRGTTKSGR